MIESLLLDLASRETFVLTGDIHHYERLEDGKLLHVSAGGGGAFLHPARIAAGGLAPTIYALIGGVVREWAVLPLALGAALVTAVIPIGGAFLVNLALERLGQSASAFLVGFVALAIAVFAGTFVFGAYLSLLTLLGYENLQAFAVLDHPGFKHFVRLRVRADGSGIDGWCVGAADPLGAGQEPVLETQLRCAMQGDLHRPW